MHAVCWGKKTQKETGFRTGNLIYCWWCESFCQHIIYSVVRMLLARPCIVLLGVHWLLTSQILAQPISHERAYSPLAVQFILIERPHSPAFNALNPSSTGPQAHLPLQAHFLKPNARWQVFCLIQFRAQPICTIPH